MELAIDEREVVALLGPNGAGKTTLLRAIAGLVPFRSGHVHLDGTVLEDTATNQYVPTERRPIGFVFQDYLLFPHLNVLDNVAFGLRSRGTARAAAAEKAAQWLDRVGLASYARAKPAELSGGQMQRVAVARALLMDPPLILADEPTGNLDSATGASILALLAEVAHEEGRGRLVVMVTHNSVAAAATDRVITLQDGRLGFDEMSVVPS